MEPARTILLFFVVLSVLVFAHELGHFVTAKMAGIKVQEFGFGYPPRVFGIRRGETVYSFNLLPLGGFVKMLGENAAPGDPEAFSSKPRGVRALVLIAGSAMNLALVPLLYSGAFMVGIDEPTRVVIENVQSDLPAARAGVRPGDAVVSVDGRDVRTTLDLRELVRSRGGQQIPLTVERGGQRVPLTITPLSVSDASQPAIGVALKQEVELVRYPVWEAVPLGFQFTGEVARHFLDGLRQIAQRRVRAELSGPVGIAQQTGEAAEAGLTYLLQFTAFLSLNLAVFNMLPFPGLDGARLIFVLIEGARRGRRINPQLEGAIHLVGMMLLVTLMLYVSLNDVRRLIPG